jgi:hypothetical protein
MERKTKQKGKREMRKRRRRRTRPPAERNIQSKPIDY